MRDIVTDFYLDVLRRLIKAETISKKDSVLVICAGPLDEKVMRIAGFADFTITNLDPDMASHRQDAENLTYKDNSFDVVIVHAGLHHCYSPHRALLEMYRVARKCVVAFESRDGMLMRAAVRFGLTLAYEVDSVTDGRGGVAETGIPNFIYRWTEREIIKTIASFDPTRPPQAQFFYEMRLPAQRFSRSGKMVARTAALMIEPLSRIVARIVPTQCNEFAFALTKSCERHPWIR